MAEHHIVTPNMYLKIFGALMVLTVLTVGAAFVNLGPLNNAVAMGIAITKALLVILFFMHVRYSTRVVWLVVASGFVWLVILFALTGADYLSRGMVDPFAAR